jgi:hypothetical protein
VKHYLVQIQYRTDAGSVSLTAFTVRAGSGSHALEMVTKLTWGTGDIIGGFVTCDPYKVEQLVRTRQAAN